MSKVAWMFTSPGAHLPGALAASTDVFTGAAPLIRAVDDVAERYGWPRVSPLLVQPEQQTESPAHLWLAFYLISLVLADRSRAAGLRADVFVGHSAGEVSALAAAGALDPGDGARVLCERFAAAAEAELPPGGMLAVQVPAWRAGHLCGAVDDGSLTVAVDNSPRQVVLSGTCEALDKVEGLAAVLGLTATRLGIPAAYHNPMFAAAARRFAAAVRDIPVRCPDTEVVSPQLGRVIRTEADVRELFAGMLLLPVGFRSVLLRLYHKGVETFIECGAKRVLSDLVPEVLPTRARAVPLLPGHAAAESLPHLLAKLAGTTSLAPALAPVPADDAAEASARVPANIAPVQADAVAIEPALTVPAPTAGGAGRPLPAQAQLIDQIRHTIADLLQYPLEVIEPEVPLDAELGVSSLKQTEATVRLLDLYGLPTPSAESGFTRPRTVAEIADLMRRLADQAA
jgi:[acyl-carrier-protein] S-malonyltransferase